MEQKEPQTLSLSQLLEESTLLKNEYLAELLSSVFVQYQLDIDLQKTIRAALGDSLQSVASDSYQAGYQKGKKTGHQTAIEESRKKEKLLQEELATELFKHIEISHIKQ